jgi:hypothetical protein
MRCPSLFMITTHTKLLIDNYTKFQTMASSSSSEQSSVVDLDRDPFEIVKPAELAVANVESECTHSRLASICTRRTTCSFRANCLVHW